MEINVLSLCDGMSCGQIALKELGIEVDKYFASEIDKYAIKVTNDNFPETIQLGDIRTVGRREIGNQIDLLLCGFPCRDLSICTRQGGSKNWNKMHEAGQGLQGTHSGLYYEFLRIYNEIKAINPNVKFLVENVASMRTEETEIINKDLGVNGININSGLFSAQDRERLYWTNILFKPLPTENKTVLKDILDSTVDDRFFETRKLSVDNLENRLIGRLQFDFSAHDIAKRVYNINFKSPTLTACRGGNLQKKIYVDGLVRKLTPNEYRKLQTIPQWYKMNVADSHIYNMCGDGWTVDLVKHLLSGLIAEQGVQI